MDGIRSGGSDSRSRGVWTPSTSGSSSIEGTKGVNKAAQSNPNVSAPTSPGGVSGAAGAPSSTVPVLDRPEFSRPLEAKDFSTHLVQMGLPNTEDNRRALLMMYQYGVELSEDNIETVKKLKESTSKSNSLESAVISLIKGLSGTPKSVDMLANFLSGNNQLSQQLEQLQLSLAGFKRNLLSFNSLLDPNLLGGMTSILSDLSDDLDKLLKKQTDKANLPEINRGKLIANFKALYDFLGGISEEFLSSLHSQSSRALDESISKMRQQLQSFLESITAHSILSKDTARQYANSTDTMWYWQIPVALSQLVKNVELMAKSKKNKGIDPNDTSLVVKLETDALGDVAITMNLKDKKISYLFQASDPDTLDFVRQMQKELKDRMDAIGYSLQDVKTTRRKLNLKKMLLPTFNFDDFKRVSIEA